LCKVFKENFIFVKLLRKKYLKFFVLFFHSKESGLSAFVFKTLVSDPDPHEIDADLKPGLQPHKKTVAVYSEFKKE